MSSPVEIADVPASSSLEPDLAELFEEYRRHYGQPSEVERSRAWLSAQLASGRLRGYLARAEGDPAGMALIVSAAASQRLGHAWQLRDLYVAERHRRQGVGRALVAHVRNAATAEGALHLSLTTEAGNVEALSLYDHLGFEPVTGYVSLSLDLGRRL